MMARYEINFLIFILQLRKNLKKISTWFWTWACCVRGNDIFSQPQWWSCSVIWNVVYYAKIWAAIWCLRINYSASYLKLKRYEMTGMEKVTQWRVTIVILKIPLGRPRCRWEDNIKDMSICLVGFTEKMALQLLFANMFMKRFQTTPKLLKSV